jgi:hypothetical protein
MAVHNPSWFDHHSLLLAWLHEEGWLLFPSGHVEAPPDDITPIEDGWPRLAYENKVQVRPFEENARWPRYRGGGKIYYMPSVNFPINSTTLRRSLVGKSQTASVTPPQGFDAQWSLNEEASVNGKNYWKVVAVVRAEGLGNATIPWWDGKSYPEWPPLPRGRPPKPPEP